MDLLEDRAVLVRAIDKLVTKLNGLEHLLEPVFTVGNANSPPPVTRPDLLALHFVRERADLPYVPNQHTNDDHLTVVDVCVATVRVEALVFEVLNLFAVRRDQQVELGSDVLDSQRTTGSLAVLGTFRPALFVALLVTFPVRDRVDTVCGQLGLSNDRIRLVTHATHRAVAALFVTALVTGEVAESLADPLEHQSLLIESHTS